MIVTQIVLVVALSAVTVVFLKVKWSTVVESKRLLAWSRRLWFAGIVLGLAATVVSWPYGPDTRVIGFPIPAMAMERLNTAEGDNQWAQFSGPLSFPIIVVNIVLCAPLPQLFVVIPALCRGRT